jgi:chorismate mutase
VSAALADPIVQALMAADRVDPQGVEELLRRITAQLASRDRVDPQGVEELLRRITAQLASQPDRWRFS